MTPKAKPKYAHGVDENQFEIVQALRATGAEIEVTANVGGGFPDLLVSRSGVTVVIELKIEGTTPSKRELQPDQQDFMRRWKGKKAVAYNIVEALDVMNRAVRGESLAMYHRWDEVSEEEVSEAVRG